MRLCATSERASVRTGWQWPDLFCFGVAHPVDSGIVTGVLTPRSGSVDSRHLVVVLIFFAGPSAGLAGAGASWPVWFFGGVASAIVLGVPIALRRLREWHDPSHGPWAGAAIMAMAAVIGLLAYFLISRA